MQVPKEFGCGTLCILHDRSKRLFWQEREDHAREMRFLKNLFAMMLTEKESEIAALMAKKGVIKDFYYEFCLHRMIGLNK